MLKANSCDVTFRKLYNHICSKYFLGHAPCPWYSATRNIYIIYNSFCLKATTRIGNTSKRGKTKDDLDLSADTPYIHKLWAQLTRLLPAPPEGAVFKNHLLVQLHTLCITPHFLHPLSTLQDQNYTEVEIIYEMWKIIDTKAKMKNCFLIVLIILHINGYHFADYQSKYFAIF